MTETVHIGWDRIWREQGPRWELQEPQPEVVELVARLKAEGKRRVHDLGCGLGRNLLVLAAEGFRASGSDISPHAVATCRRRLEEAGLSAVVTLSEMTDIPEENASLDCVIAWHVVYHAMGEGMRRTLQGIRDKLKPGGYFFGTFASTSHGACELSRREAAQGLAEQLETHSYVRPHDTVGDKQLIHHYTSEDELKGRFLDGFELLSLDERHEGAGAHWVVLARKTDDSLRRQAKSMR